MNVTQSIQPILPKMINFGHTPNSFFAHIFSSTHTVQPKQFIQLNNPTNSFTRTQLMVEIVHGWFEADLKQSTIVRIRRHLFAL